MQKHGPSPSDFGNRFLYQGTNIFYLFIYLMGEMAEIRNILVFKVQATHTYFF